MFQAKHTIEHEGSAHYGFDISIREGVAQGQRLTTTANLFLDDIYMLESDHTQAKLPANITKKPFAAIQATFMSDCGQTCKALILSDAKDHGPAQIIVLPQTPMVARLLYRLIDVAYDLPIGEMIKTDPVATA